ncbi:PREDICTED: uncharacterized protein LOC106344043 isoform X2 [Brassica oleracea var. oleracea]|uniref:uncharacterized protein LOC106344043 isoform X2 n=1 Tax=Brassica oleracea var. oleracea TaxID=109376 RepID=UPI0006A6C380|nr:PREDICTED: uncharacterized protein LOC106344043 isoform X2 [Brassica oleracea var. oleracea]
MITSLRRVIRQRWKLGTVKTSKGSLGRSLITAEINTVTRDCNSIRTLRASLDPDKTLTRLLTLTTHRGQLLKMLVVKRVRTILLDPSCSGSGTIIDRLDHLLPSHSAAGPDFNSRRKLFIKQLCRLRRKSLQCHLQHGASKLS